MIHKSKRKPQSQFKNTWNTMKVKTQHLCYAAKAGLRGKFKAQFIFVFIIDNYIGNL